MYIHIGPYISWKNSAFGVHDPMHSEASPKPGWDWLPMHPYDLVGGIGADTTAIKKMWKKSNEANERKPQLEKLDLEKKTGGKMFVGKTFCFLPIQWAW